MMFEMTGADIEPTLMGSIVQESLSIDGSFAQESVASDLFLSPWSLSNGARIGPYQILEPIGRGGMGEVYRAKHTKLGREVAVKVLYNTGADPARLRRFALEAQVLAGLQHPGVLSVYDYGFFDEVPYLVMELLRGETLKSRLSRGPMSVAEVIEWTGQLTRALTAVHRRGIVHRDLKPDNLFRTTAGVVKILDFGLAKLVQGTSDVHGTQEGTLLGTADYMAPEQVRGEPVDARSDVFALCSVIYEMLTRKKPFRRSTPIVTMYAVATEEATPLSSILPEIPPAIEDALARGMMKDPKERFQDAGELMEALVEGPADQKARKKKLVRNLPMPVTRYTKCGDAHLAYQVFGDGPINLVFVAGFISQLEVWWEQPEGARFFSRLAELARVVIFDKRGSGLSDRSGELAFATLEQKMDEVCAVMDAAGMDQAVLFGMTAGICMSSMFSVKHRARTSGLIIYGSAPSFADTMALDEMRELIRERWGQGGSVEILSPSSVGDKRIEQWVARWERLSASPGTALAIFHMLEDVDLRAVLPQVDVPVLVQHRRGDRMVSVEGGRELARLMPNAVYAEYDGDDHPPMMGNMDALLDDIERFLSSLSVAPRVA
jgi:pimeloyl-ACP methyl ester carboxylesterase